MIKKKFISLFSIICILGLFAGCNSSSEKNTQTSSSSTASDKIQEEMASQLQDLSEMEKIEIGRYLFDKYINENTTDWQMVKSQNLNREPVTCLTDYRIGDIDFVKEDDDKFTVDISYDIQYTDESSFWIAGNGELADDNWVINKCNFVDIQKDGDKYVIVNIYTG